ncbi:unnamed protein product [Sphagnum troendelagicum]
MEEVIEEELMALESIFYDSYSKLSDNRFRIRIDPDVEDEGGGGDLPPPLFLEVLLPEGYPETLPQFDVSNINNRKYPESVKSAIVEGLLQQAGQQRGESMCYNLVEWLKEQLLSFYALKPPPTPQDSDSEDLGHGDARPGSGALKKETNAKDKLTKAQKRRHFDKYGAGSEKPRGWDWVPILSHLGQVPHVTSSVQ